MSHRNSQAAYKSILESLPVARREVLRTINKHQPVTRQAAAEIMGVPINCVTGRVRELLEANLCHESGDILGEGNRPRALLCYGPAT